MPAQLSYLIWRVCVSTQARNVGAEPPEVGPPQTSEPPPQTAESSAESSIVADPPSEPAAAAAMAAFGGKPGGLGKPSACNWGKAKVGLDLTEAVENVQKERANPMLHRASFQGVVESAKNLAEERKQAKKYKQEMSQYFNPSVVGSVNRHRRIHSSRRTRLLILLDEPRTSYAIRPRTPD